MFLSPFRVRSAIGKTLAFHGTIKQVPGPIPQAGDQLVYFLSNFYKKPKIIGRDCGLGICENGSRKQIEGFFQSPKIGRKEKGFGRERRRLSNPAKCQATAGPFMFFREGHDRKMQFERSIRQKWRSACGTALCSARIGAIYIDPELEKRAHQSKSRRMRWSCYAWLQKGLSKEVIAGPSQRALFSFVRFAPWPISAIRFEPGNRMYAPPPAFEGRTKLEGRLFFLFGAPRLFRSGRVHHEIHREAFRAAHEEVKNQDTVTDGFGASPGSASPSHWGAPGIGRARFRDFQKCQLKNWPRPGVCPFGKRNKSHQPP